MEADLIAHDPYRPERPALSVIEELHAIWKRRRSVRAFSDEAVDRQVIEGLIRCATTAPSGANKQPWHFVCISDRATKRQIRLAAEKEERAFYEQRATEAWLRDLAPLGTDADKSFLEVAPWLVVLFKQVRAADGGKHYYIDESVGIAAGLFLGAAQQAGLATLTHTPSPMGFLREILDRPKEERAFLLIPVGYPAKDCQVPRAATLRKPLEDVVDFIETPSD